MKTYTDWIDYMEHEGAQVALRMDEIIAKQGKRERYTIEDVQNAQKQAEQELGIR